MGRLPRIVGAIDTGDNVAKTARKDRWLTLAEVAEAEGVEPRTIRKRVEKGRFPAPARFQRKHEPKWSAAQIKAIKDPDPEPSEGVRLSRAERNEITRAAAVQRFLDEVRWWTWEHGQADIPSRATGRTIGGRPYRIGAKTTATRTAYRRGALSAAEIAAFEALPGWTWDHVKDSWRDKFDDVLTRWPTRLTSGDRTWLAVQRSRYESLPEENKTLLRSVPGLLDYRGNRRVDEFIEAVSRWLDENPGKTTYSIGYSDCVKVRGETVQIGRRVTYYRRRYLGREGTKPLTESEIARIEALPGWSWEMSERHMINATKRRKQAS